MPTDKHGMTHAGSLGLFDDEDEYDAAKKRAERHERERLGSEIRRQERLEGKEHRKATKVAQQAEERKSILMRSSVWLGSLLIRKKHGDPNAKKAASDSGGSWCILDSKEKEPDSVQRNYVIVPRPSALAAVYTAEDVDPVDSPWLRECGMVRVKSNDPGGCHIVPKSSIQKSE